MKTITPYKYLKDDIYYNEFYDRLTVEACRRWESKKDDQDIAPLKENEDPRLAGIKNGWITNAVIPVALYYLIGEYYTQKAETIRQWTERDQAKDERVATAQVPRGIRCLGCSTPMECISRDLHINSHNDNQVLFMFECQQCHSRRLYWEDGQEWVLKKNPCPQCRTGMESKSIRDGNIIKTEYTCSGCEHKETDTWDLDKKKEDTIDSNFEADRKKYCLSDEEGMKYIDGAVKLKHVTDMIKDQQENTEVYDAVAKIKKLTILELQNLLNPVIDRAGYIKLEFDKPDMTKDVVVGFSLQDNKPGRGDRNSVYELQGLIKKALGGTNWRLMSDGISYRLGFLNGRFSGVEGEVALIKLTGLQKKDTRGM